MVINKVVDNLRSNSRRLIVIPGNFNVVHAGHIRLFEFAKSVGDDICIALFIDGDGIYVSDTDRVVALDSIGLIDFVLPLTKNEYSDFLKACKPYAVIKGQEHEFKNNFESSILKEYGGHLIFAADKTKYSAKSLFKKDLSLIEEIQISHDFDYLEKSKLDFKKCKSIIDSFGKLRVLVYGDLILDEYVSCVALGMSQEDPTIVVNPVGSKKYVGGAGIVASHCRSLGAKVDFLSVVGVDDSADFCAEALRETGVTCNFLIDHMRPTTKKTRFKVGSKTMLRVNDLSSQDIDDLIQEEIIHFIKKNISEWDYIIFSDFNYGSIPDKLLATLLPFLKENGKKFSADSQASSQEGNIARFEGAHLIAATEREARLALVDHKSSIQHLSNNLIDQTDSQHVVIKLGAEGMLVNELNYQGNKYVTHSINALNVDPVDVSGAGDAFLSACSLSLAAGGDIWESAYIGSIASAIQISRVGNLSINIKQLLGSFGN